MKEEGLVGGVSWVEVLSEKLITVSVLILGACLTADDIILIYPQAS